MRWLLGARITANLLLLLLAVVLFTPSVLAASQKDSTIEVRLCPQPGDSYMTLNSPIENEVIENGEVLVKGEAASLYEIKFYVNDIHRTTLKMGGSAVGYEQPLSLGPGNQLIKAIGYDLCRNVIDTFTVAVSVPILPEPEEGPLGGNSPGTSPPGQPGTKGKTPRRPIVYYKTPDGGITTNPFLREGKQSDESPAEPSPAETEQAWIDRLAAQLDIEATFRNTANVIRAIVAITGTYLAFVPHVALFVWRLLVWPITLPASIKRNKKSVARQKMRRRYKLEIRILGVILLISLFIV